MLLFSTVKVCYAEMPKNSKKAVAVKGCKYGSRPSPLLLTYKNSWSEKLHLFKSKRIKEREKKRKPLARTAPFYTIDFDDQFEMELN